MYETRIARFWVAPEYSREEFKLGSYIKQTFIFTRDIPNEKNKLFVIFLLAFMIIGCVFDGGSKIKIVGNYYLWQWEGGRSYYLVDKHTSPNGGGLIDGTVQIIAWSDIIYIQKKPLFSGEKKGWVIIDVKNQKITKTISEQVMRERLSANGDSNIQFYSAESAWRKLNSTLENNQASPSATSIQNKNQTCQTYSEIVVMEDSLSESLRQNCSLWLNSWEEALQTDRFTLVRSYASPLSTDWEKFDISEKNFSDYQDKIYYSPNGSYALDLYSYNLILNKKGAKTHAVLDADIQIYVIDIAHHQRLPILFLGPSASINDGYWLSDSTVILVGWERCFDCTEEEYRPDVCKVNVFTGETVKYDYIATFSHYNKDFLKQKFPKIIFDF